MKVTPLTKAYGLRIEGVDVRRLSDAEREEIIRAGNMAGVLHIPGQALSEEEQLEFTRNYGRVRVLRLNRARNSQRPPGIVEISNVDAEGNVVPPTNDMMRFSRGNMMWHSDYSYTAERAAQSILYALEAVSVGGETEWASTEAAYDVLPDGEKVRLLKLTATHDRFHSRIKSGFTEFTEEDYRLTPPVSHPLVTTHPVTGRKSLLLGSHVSAIDGMTEAEAMTLAAELIEHCTQPEFVYTHSWTQRDIVVWDNRSTLHRGRPADPSERRVMRRTAVFSEGVERPEVQVVG